MLWATEAPTAFVTSTVNPRTANWPSSRYYNTYRVGGDDIQISPAALSPPSLVQGSASGGVQIGRLGGGVQSVSGQGLYRAEMIKTPV